jgi:cyclophilin family peptidyl-prolyl cis-trans isomerase
MNNLKHDAPGIVSVRRGNTSGFGFMIYPGGGSDKAVSSLDENHIVVGKVLEGMDVVQQLNDVPVDTSAKVNYMGLTGGQATKDAPNRGCYYGGPMYCNENKPLQKLSVISTGIL